jgi:tetratricopeptide (TPR) repeat protein
MLREAANAWEQLVRQAANLLPSEAIADPITSEAQEAKQRREGCAAPLDNLSATLGSLANALRNTGRLDEALRTAEQGVEIDRAVGHIHNAVVGLVQTACILLEQGRYQEADARYDQALEAARRLGDRELEGTILQHQGGLADEILQYDRAVDLCKQALRLFQDASNEASIMRTGNLLGSVELDQ